MNKSLIFVAIAALMLTASCVDRADIPVAGGEETIALSLKLPDSATKADVTPVGNENLYTSVDYFFYPDVEAAPALHIRDDSVNSFGADYPISLKAGVTAPSFSVLLNASGECEFYAIYNYPAANADFDSLPLAQVKALAAANSFSYSVVEDGNTTWHVTQDEEAERDSKYFIMTGQETLELSSAGLRVKDKEQSIVNMVRLAAKVSVILNIAQVVDASAAGNGIWKPIIGGNNVRLYLCNFVRNALIGAVDKNYPTSYEQSDYANYLLNTDGLTASDGIYTVSSVDKMKDNDPGYFYTYPIAWTQGADNEPFIKFILPWKKVAALVDDPNTSGIDESEQALSQKEIYYKIMFPKDITSFESNKHYQLTVNVSVLGTEGEPTVELKAQSIQVVGWGTDDDVNPVISAAKYLSVQKTNVTFYTANDGTNFSASENASIKILNVYHKDLKTGNDEYIVKNGVLQTNVRTDLGNKSLITENGLTVGLKVGEKDWIRLNNTVSYLQFGHDLDKSLTSVYMDVTPWYYEVEVHLGPADTIAGSTYNDESYIKTVTFVQWPEVYVLEDPNRSTNNYGYVFLNTYDKNSTVTSRYNNNNYTTNVDGSTIAAYNAGSYYYPSYALASANYIGGVHGLTGLNQNGSMYVLTISVSDNYIIGDPRSSSVSNPSFTYTGFRRTSNQTIQGYQIGEFRTFTGSWNSAAFTNGNNHALTYYHPASSDNTANMIAPKIRVASSYGVCTTGISEPNAIARCAAYQEDGIPAGRWRLPTLAEVEFISTLSALGRIPYLFGNSEDAVSDGESIFYEDSYYWTANGRIRVNNGNKEVEPSSSGEGESVRCVYDEWFWGDATTSRPVNAATFTWGDRNY